MFQHEMILFDGNRLKLTHKLMISNMYNYLLDIFCFSSHCSILQNYFWNETFFFIYRSGNECFYWRQQKQWGHILLDESMRVNPLALLRLTVNPVCCSCMNMFTNEVYYRVLSCSESRSPSLPRYPNRCYMNNIKKTKCSPNTNPHVGGAVVEC